MAQREEKIRTGQELLNLEDLRQQYFGQSLVSLLLKQTPKEVVKTRKIRGGGYAEYAPVWWVQDQLNALFGFFWDFEVIDKGVDLDNLQVWVHGKLTVKFFHNGTLCSISKSNFGGGGIKTYAYDSPLGEYKAGDIIDLADDLKAAASDCIRKCASMLGMMADLYSKDTEKVLTPSEAELKALRKKADALQIDLDNLCMREYQRNPADLSRDEYLILMKTLTKSMHRAEHPVKIKEKGGNDDGKD